MLFQLSTNLYLLTSILIGFIKCRPNNYIHAEMEGNLDDKRGFNFTLVTRNSSGVILYAVNSERNFLIKLENSRIIMKYKNYTIEKPLWKICGFSVNHFWKYFVMLRHLEVQVTCDGKFHSLVFKDIKKGHISNFCMAIVIYSNYPKPKELKESSSKSYIWMGNVGPYTGEGDVVTQPMKNQLYGCLDKFYFHYKLIQMFTKASDFKVCSDNFYNETICYNETSCQKKVTSYKIDDCSLLSMNGIYCLPNYQIYGNLVNSFQRSDQLKKIVNFKLYWKSLLENNFCLLEIKSRDSTIVIFINQNSQMKMKLPQRNKILLRNLSIKNKRNIQQFLLVSVTPSELWVKVYSDGDIKVFVTSIKFDPITINVGKSQQSEICRTFQGMIDVQYDPTQFTLDVGILKKPLFISGILLVLFVGLLVVYFLKVKTIRFSSMSECAWKSHLKFKKTDKTFNREDSDKYSTIYDS